MGKHIRINSQANFYFTKEINTSVITFSPFKCHSSPLFNFLQIIKLFDLVTFHIAIFMYKFHNQLLPATFHSYFTKVTNVQSHNTRLASKQSYHIPYVRTNYGKFSVRFIGPSIRNTIGSDIKSSSLAKFKKKIKQQYLDKY